MPKLHVRADPDIVLGYALAFVVAWFGMNEILAPQEWTTFAPPFLGEGPLVTGLVVAHGIVLAACALMLVFRVYPRIAAGVLVLIFAEVILGLVTQTGLSDIAVRDIGLLGLSLGIALRPKKA